MSEEVITFPTRLPSLDRVLAILRADHDRLIKRYHIRQIGIFGSYVRGEQRPTSDIDVLVDFEVTPSIFSLLALEDDLYELLGLPIDIAVKSALRPHLGAQILHEVITL